MSKPIEIGCLAIVLGGRANVGKIVRVFGEDIAVKYADGYLVKLPEAAWVVSREGHTWVVESVGTPLLCNLGDVCQAVPYFEEELLRLPDEEDVNKYDEEQKTYLRGFVEWANQSK